jgi:hypothetical protein
VQEYDDFTTGNGNTTEIMYRLMMIANNNSDAIAFLDDPQALMVASPTVFKGISAQIARQYLFVDSGRPLAEQVIYLENRLHVKVLSVWLMGVGLLFMTLVGVLVFWLCPRKVVPQDPTTIRAIATLSVSSTLLNTSLKNTGHVKPRELRELISSARYQTTASETEQAQPFFIEQRNTTESNLQSSGIPSAHTEIPWYRPISVRILVLIFAIFLPVALIIALEILQRISDRNDGFVNIGHDTVRLALTEYIPAAVMLLFAALIGSMASTIKILLPMWRSRKVTLQLDGPSLSISRGK